MGKGPSGLAIASIAIVALLLGCGTRTPEKVVKPDRRGNRYFQRTVSDYQGGPMLRITGEYTGKQPFPGYEIDVPWQTVDTDFYTIEFKNLTRNKIAFISKKVYRRNARASGGEAHNPLPALIEYTDFANRPDSDFAPLEPLEKRKLINWAIHTHNQRPDDVANIVFRIRHAAREYTFNIFLAYHR